MKRSTLTLSILTALLVSACGGSSSNDEQTKDPTPPKVTPTKPTPPSSGQTPTTGNTGNAGTSGSSAGSSSASNSSDPTPPISSGSAPSGGKPIVITSETGKTKEKDKDKDKEPKDDPIKTLEAQLAKAKEDLKSARVAVNDAKADLDGFKPNQVDSEKSVASRAWKKQKEWREKFLVSDNKLHLPVSPTANNADKIGVKSIEASLEKYKSTLPPDELLTLETNLKGYKEAREEWINADQEVYTKIETLYNAEKQASEDQKKFDSLAAELRKKTADPIKAEADFYDKQIKLIEQQYQQSQKAAELKKIEEELAQKKTDADSSLKNIKDDLIYARDTLKSKDPNIATELAEIEKKIEANKADQATLTAEQKRLTNEKTPLDNRITELKKDVEKAKEIAGNRGVSAIGAAGLSKDNFLQIQSAELVKSDTTPQTWKLTFSDGSSRDIDIRDSSNGGGSLSQKIQFGSGNTVYGNFKATAASSTANASVIAFQDSSTSKSSIYGYIDDRFYSVGKVADPKVVDSLKNTYLIYSGKALLQAEQGTGLIADIVGGHVYQGEFGGRFENFATYDRAATNEETAKLLSSSNDDNLKALKEALANPVPFSASVQGNKFMTKSPNEGEASVYGYFYGSETEVKEAGGLVQLKDVFHGSFGGEVKVKSN